MQHLVEGGALGGDKPRLQDEGLDLFNSGAVVEPRLLHHVLVKEGSAKVVAAEVERHLPRLLALGEPGGLDMLNIVQIEARQGYHAQIAVGSRLDLDPLVQGGVGLLEAPGNEGGKASRLILEFSDVIQMLDLFDIDHAAPSWPTNRWVGAMIRLFRPQVEWLLRERDEAVRIWQACHPDDPAHEDHGLEVPSRIQISIDDQVRRVREAAG